MDRWESFAEKSEELNRTGPLQAKSVSMALPPDIVSHCGCQAPKDSANICQQCAEIERSYVKLMRDVIGSLSLRSWWYLKDFGQLL